MLTKIAFSLFTVLLLAKNSVAADDDCLNISTIALNNLSSIVQSSAANVSNLIAGFNQSATFYNLNGLKLYQDKLTSLQTTYVNNLTALIAQAEANGTAANVTANCTNGIEAEFTELRQVSEMSLKQCSSDKLYFVQQDIVEFSDSVFSRAASEVDVYNQSYNFCRNESTCLCALTEQIDQAIIDVPTQIEQLGTTAIELLSPGLTNMTRCGPNTLLDYENRLIGILANAVTCLTPSPPVNTTELRVNSENWSS